jgi:RHS repeat-associated protein
MKRFFANMIFGTMVLIAIYASPSIAESEYGETGGKNTAQGRSLEVGDPISAANGAYSFSLPMLNLGGPMNLNFTLLYSQNSSNMGGYSPIGFPNSSGIKHFWWSPAVIAHLWGYPSYIHLSNGDTVNLEKKADGTYSLYEDPLYPDNGSSVRYVMKETANYAYMMDPVNERIYIFERSTCIPNNMINPIKWIMDRNGNRLTYTYNSQTGKGCQLTKIEDGLGRSLDFIYTALGGTDVINQIRDQSGRIVTLAFEAIASDNDGNAALRSVKDPMNQTYTFHYQTVTQGAAKYVGNIYKVVNPKGNTPYQNQYVYSAVTLSGFDIQEAVRVSQQTDHYGDSFTMNYNSASYKTTVSYPDGKQEVFEHFSAHTPPSGLTDSEGKKSSFGKNALNQTTSVTDRLGDISSFTYHAETGKLASATNALGKTVSYTYTAQNQNIVNPANSETVSFTFYNLTKTVYPDGSSEEFSYDTKGNMLAHKDRAGKSWDYTYNTMGQVLTVINPTGGVITNTYNNADGTLVSGKDSDTGTTNYSYDAYKRLSKTTYPDEKFLSIAYNLNDRITSITDANGNTIVSEYDANGNLTKITDPNGNFSTYTYDLMDRLMQTTNRRSKSSAIDYDSRSRVAAITDPNNIVTTFGYDSHGWRTGVTVDGKTSKTDYDAEGIISGETTPMNRSITFASDKLGRITGVTDPLSRKTSFVYDDLSRLKSLTDPLSRTTSYTYDIRGLLTGVALPNTTASAYSYNDSGLLGSITDLNNQNWRFGYTAQGGMNSMTDPLGNKWQYSIDTRGRLSQTTYPNSVTLTPTYNNTGNIIRQDYSDGLSFTYDYDKLNRLTGTDGVTFAYDAEGNVTDAVQNGRHFTAAYDNGGRLQTLSYDNNALIITYTCNNRGLLSRVSDNRGTSADFNYDDDNRLTGIQRSNSVNSIYDFDAAGQLARIREGSFIDAKYTYDAAGQIISADITAPLTPDSALALRTTSLTYDAASQISSAGYTHDVSGRMTASPDSEFTWDSASRLTKIGQTTLEYNGLDNLIRRTEGTTTVRYSYTHAIGLNPIVAEANGSDVAQRYYVWTPDGQLLWYYDVTAGYSVYFYHFDNIGTTLAMTNGSGAITDKYAYEPFGKILAHQGISVQPFTFLGKWGVRQENANIYHARARYYDAFLGRFISREPIFPQIADPNALNPYQYAENNPLNYMDITGMTSEWGGDSEAAIAQMVRTASLNINFFDLSGIQQLAELAGQRQSPTKILNGNGMETAGNDRKELRSAAKKVRKLVDKAEKLAQVIAGKPGLVLKATGMSVQASKLAHQGIRGVAVARGASKAGAVLTSIRAASAASKGTVALAVVGAVIDTGLSAERIYVMTNVAANSSRVGEENKATWWDPLTKIGNKMGHWFGDWLYDD